MSPAAVVDSPEITRVDTRDNNWSGEFCELVDFAEQTLISFDRATARPDALFGQDSSFHMR